MDIDDDPPFIGVLIADSRTKDHRSLFTARRHVFRLSWKPQKQEDPKDKVWERVSPRLESDISALVQHSLTGHLFAGTATGHLWWFDADAASSPLTLTSKAQSCRKCLVRELWHDLSRETPARIADLPMRYTTRIVPTLHGGPGNPSMALYVCFAGSGLETNPPDTAKIPRKELSGQVFYGVLEKGKWRWKNCSGSTEKLPNRTLHGLEKLPNRALHGLAFDPDHPQILYAASDVGVYRSIDGGDTWHPFIDDLPFVPCFDICLSKTADGEPDLLRVATHGRGIFERKIPPIE